MKISDSNILMKLRAIGDNFDEFAIQHTISYQQKKVFSTKSFNYIRIQPMGIHTNTYTLIVDKIDIISVDLYSSTAKSDIFNDKKTVKILQVFIEEAETMMNETTTHEKKEKKIKYEKIITKMDKLIKNHKL